MSKDSVSLAEFIGNLSLLEYVALFGSRENPETRQRVPFNPWEGQCGLMNWSEGRRECWYPKARQLGISEIAAEKAAKSALELPGSQTVVISKNEPDAIYFLAERAVPKLQYLPQIEGIVWPQIEDQTQKRLVLSNGSVTSSLPAANGSGASRTLNGWIVDEAGGIDSTPNAKFAILYRNLKPTIEKAKSTGWGWVIGTSEPGSFFNEMLDRQYSGKAPAKYYFLSWRTDPNRDEAWRDAQLQDYETEADFRNQYPETMEEFFASREGAVFPSFDYRDGGRHVREFEPNWNFEYICGYDHGFNCLAAFLHCLYNRDTDVLYVFDEQTWKSVEAIDIAEEVRVKLADMPKQPSKKLADTSIWNRDGRTPVSEMFAQRGLRFDPAWKTQEETSRGMLSERFTKDKILIHPRCRVTIKQLRSYIWKTTGLGDKPANGNNDTIDVLRYICAHIRKKEPTLAQAVVQKARGYGRNIPDMVERQIYNRKIPSSWQAM